MTKQMAVFNRAETPCRQKACFQLTRPSCESWCTVHAYLHLFERSPSLPGRNPVLLSVEADNEWRRPVIKPQPWSDFWDSLMNMSFSQLDWKMSESVMHTWLIKFHEKVLKESWWKSLQESDTWLQHSCECYIVHLCEEGALWYLSVVWEWSAELFIQQGVIFILTAILLHSPSTTFPLPI